MNWNDRRRERIEAGLCPRCPRQITKGSLCDVCRAKNVVVMRGIKGCGKRKKYGRGRPPLEEYE